MAFKGELDLVSGNTRAVIADTDLTLATRADLDSDAGSAGVDGVLDRFLDHCGRMLDRLSCSDLSDGKLVQALN